MPFLKMNIAGELFLEVEVDFSGKKGRQVRQDYLEDIAAVLASEYEQEIATRVLIAETNEAPAVEFYIVASSRMEHMEFTPFDMEEFDIKLKAARFIKQNTKADGKK